VSLPVILRHEAEVDVQEARDQLEAVRVGLGTQVLARLREVLARKAEAVPLYRLLHCARRSCRGAGCPPRRSGPLFLAITGINSKCAANQALEQPRDSVRRRGEPVGRELLNLVVLRQVRRGSAVRPRLAFYANIAVDLMRR
jgi:hypothetical protein